MAQTLLRRELHGDLSYRLLSGAVLLFSLISGLSLTVGLNVVNLGGLNATINIGRDVGHLTNTLRTSYQKACLQQLLDLRADSVPVIVAHLDELIGKDTPGMTPSERLELLNRNCDFSGGDWRSWNWVRAQANALLTGALP